MYALCFSRYTDTAVGWTAVDLSFASRQRQVAFFFLGSLAELRKATVSFVIFVVCTSARMEQLGFHWRGFQEI